MKIIKSIQRKRRGASTVEFAVVAPVFFLAVFACIEFSRFWVAEAYVESAVFRTARDLSVFGAQVDEGRDFVIDNNLLSVVGIDEFEILVEAFQNNVPQAEIDDATTRIAVTITVPPEEISLFNGILSETPISRTAESFSNRPN